MHKVKSNITMKAKLRFIAAITSSVAMVAGISSCSNASQENTSSKSTPIAVEVGYPSSNQNSNFEVSGKVEAKQVANISTKLMGYITKIHAKVGDHVVQGQLLASIESQDIQAKKAQAQAMVAEADAAFSNAQKDYERFQQLYNQQSASTKELENMKLQYTSAKSRLEAAKQMRNEASSMLTYTQLRAPFAGTVTQKLADQGSMASPGMPILTVEQEGVFQIKAILPESSIGNIKQGNPVMVFIKSINKTFKAKIDELSTSSLYSGGQYDILVNVPSSEKSNLFSGQYANVTIEGKPAAISQKANLILIPESSIVRKDQLTGVYTISTNGTALLRWIRLGKSYGSNIEVLSGVAANEKIIVQSNGKLYNGAPVTIK
jgi:RND family efflux transporter MFP subunit